MSLVGLLFDAGMAVATRLAGLKRRTLEVGAERWAYLDNEAQGPALLLVHGFAANKESWLQVAGRLKDRGLRIVVPDLPGFGASTPAADGAYAIEAQAARLRRFARMLGLERFHLAGHSMGGYLAAAYAQTWPQELASVYLVAPAGVGGGMPGWLRERTAREGQNPLIVRTVAQLKAAMAMAMHKPVRIPEAVARLLVVREAPLYALRVAQTSFWSGTALETMLKDTALRLRLAWGVRDRVLPIESAAAVLEAAPRASLWRIPDVGHMPPQECAAHLADDLARFIEQKD